jgi:hypothetical protein
MWEMARGEHSRGRQRQGASATTILVLRHQQQPSHWLLVLRTVQNVSGTQQQCSCAQRPGGKQQQCYCAQRPGVTAHSSSVTAHSALVATASNLYLGCVSCETGVTFSRAHGRSSSCAHRGLRCPALCTQRSGHIVGNPCVLALVESAQLCLRMHSGSSICARTAGTMQGCLHVVGCWLQQQACVL